MISNHHIEMNVTGRPVEMLSPKGFSGKYCWTHSGIWLNLQQVEAMWIECADGEDFWVIARVGNRYYLVTREETCDEAYKQMLKYMESR